MWQQPVSVCVFVCVCVCVRGWRNDRAAAALTTRQEGRQPVRERERGGRHWGFSSRLPTGKGSVSHSDREARRPARTSERREEQQTLLGSGSRGQPGQPASESCHTQHMEIERVEGRQP